MGRKKRAPIKVRTPGSYGKDKNKDGDRRKQNKEKEVKKKKKVVGRPKSKQASYATKRKDNYRTRYTKEDMEEAIRLVQEKNYSVKRAALAINSIKKTVVPRMTLNDRMNRKSPEKEPRVGRPVELSVETEEAIVKCLVLCAEYQYPMKKRDVRLLIQSYCIENSIETRWKDSKPGTDWVRSFQRRWSHKVKVRKPTNIKRCRAKVSPEIVREYFSNLQPNVEGIPPSHIYNYDETNLKDDPGKQQYWYCTDTGTGTYHLQIHTLPILLFQIIEKSTTGSLNFFTLITGSEEAFFGGGSKYFEQIKNSSKEAFSIMFCCSADGHMLPPMVVYKSTTGTVYEIWCEGGPEGATYAASQSGWFDMSKFNQWFKVVFVTHIKTLPMHEVKVIIGDNLAAHMSPYVTMMCELYNIRYGTNTYRTY